MIHSELKWLFIIIELLTFDSFSVIATRIIIICYLNYIINDVLFIKCIIIILLLILCNFNFIV